MNVFKSLKKKKNCIEYKVFINTLLYYYTIKYYGIDLLKSNKKILILIIHRLRLLKTLTNTETNDIKGFLSNTINDHLNFYEMTYNNNRFLCIY